jgi:hypothetical protein
MGTFRVLSIFAAVSLLAGCNDGIPSAYQGTYYSNDSRITVQIVEDRVQIDDARGDLSIPQNTFKGVISSYEKIVAALATGTTGVYVEKALLKNVSGDWIASPWGPHVKEGNAAGYASSKDVIDVYVVLGVRGVGISRFEGSVIHFHANNEAKGPIAEFEIDYSKTAVLEVGSGANPAWSVSTEKNQVFDTLVRSN